jgi:hypothetical protein
MEKSSAGVTYGPEFAKNAQFRAIEIMLTVLINELPNAPRFEKLVEKLISAEEALHMDVVNSLAAPARESATEVVKRRMTEIRQEVHRVSSGTVPAGPR